MKVTATQMAGAHVAAAAGGGRAEQPTRPPVRILGSDPKPVLSAENETRAEKTDADLKRMVDAANRAIEHTKHSVHIEKHDPTNRFVMKLVDDGGKVVRQYPSEDFLKVAERLGDLRGMLFASEG